MDLLTSRQITRDLESVEGPSRVSARPSSLRVANEGSQKLVEPLKGEYLEKLLGNDVYQKLVLLEGLRPDSDNMRRKRPAEEGSDDDRKRVKTSREPEA